MPDQIPRPINDYYSLRHVIQELSLNDDFTSRITKIHISKKNLQEIKFFNPAVFDAISIIEINGFEFHLFEISKLYHKQASLKERLNELADDIHKNLSVSSLEKLRNDINAFISKVCYFEKYYGGACFFGNITNFDTFRFRHSLDFDKKKNLFTSSLDNSQGISALISFFYENKPRFISFLNHIYRLGKDAEVFLEKKFSLILSEYKSINDQVESIEILFQNDRQMNIIKELKALDDSLNSILDKYPAEIYTAVDTVLHNI